MSLYSLATSLFADMDKARAVGAENGRKDEFRVTARSEGEFLPRLTSGGRDDDDAKQATPTLELLEGCLHDVQKVTLLLHRRMQQWTMLNSMINNRTRS